MVCSRCGASFKKGEQECWVCKPPLDWADKAAQRIIRDHKGSWGDSYSQLDWLASVMREEWKEERLARVKKMSLKEKRFVEKRKNLPQVPTRRELELKEEVKSLLRPSSETMVPSSCTLFLPTTNLIDGIRRRVDTCKVCGQNEEWHKKRGLTEEQVKAIADGGNSSAYW